MKKKNKTSYFTDDIQSKIREMSNSEVNELLLDLESSRHWIAILKYIQDRQAYAKSSLESLDPVKDIVTICRNQGILLGLSDLISAVIILKDKADRNSIPEVEGSPDVQEDESEPMED